MTRQRVRCHQQQSSVNEWQPGCWASLAFDQYDQFHMLDCLCSRGGGGQPSTRGKLNATPGDREQARYNEQVMTGERESGMVAGPVGPLISMICFTCSLVGCYTECTVCTVHGERRSG